MAPGMSVGNQRDEVLAVFLSFRGAVCKQVVASSVRTGEAGLGQWTQE